MSGEVRGEPDWVDSLRRYWLAVPDWHGDIYRRLQDICATGLIGKPSCGSLLEDLVTVFTRLRMNPSLQIRMVLSLHMRPTRSGVMNSALQLSRLFEMFDAEMKVPAE